MRFSAVASAALLLAPFTAAQFGQVRGLAARDLDGLIERDFVGLSKRDLEEFDEEEEEEDEDDDDEDEDEDEDDEDAGPVFARTLTHHQVQQKQDYIKAKQVKYNQKNGDLDWYHKNGGTHKQLGDTHAKMASAAHKIANTRHEVNQNHPDHAPDAGHHHEAEMWRKQGNSHDKFAAAHHAAARTGH